jgi:hypothetical protein
VITAFSELNFKIIKIGVVGAGRGKSLNKHIFIFFVQGPVNGFLDVGHFYINDCFLKGRNRLFYIFFHSTEHVGFEDFVKAFYLFLGGEITEVSSEVIVADEFFGMNVVEQTPEFTGVVLNGGAC